MSAGRGLRPALDRGTRMSPNGAGTDTGASARFVVVWGSGGGC
jgi:hypothetical protein